MAENLKIGSKYYYRIDYTGKVDSGKAIRLTKKFCVLSGQLGTVKRKAKHLLFESEDEVKVNTIKEIDSFIQQQFNLNIMELSKVLQEAIEKYPEKFI